MYVFKTPVVFDMKILTATLVVLFITKLLKNAMFLKYRKSTILLTGVDPVKGRGGL